MARMPSGRPVGVRLNPRQDERCRSAIQTTKILQRVNKHAMGKIEMTATQIKAAEILLRKTMPDLKAIEHQGDGGPLVVKIVRYSDKAEDKPNE